MKKTLMALAAAATLTVAALAAPAPAQAGDGGAIAAGVLGGLAAGAIIGGAAAGHPHGYYGRPAYVVGPRYHGCYWTRQRYWDGFEWRKRRVRVCN